MRQVTITELNAELQTLARQVGAERFAEAKRLQMEKVAIVDEDGKPVDPEEIEMRMYRRAAEEEEMEEKADDKEEMPYDKMTEDEDEEKETKKSLRLARSKAFSAGVPAVRSKRFAGRVKNFVSDENGDAHEKALAFGHFIGAAAGIRKSINFCEKNDLLTKAHTEGVNSAGGFLVPEVFETELIRLREEFGIARSECRVRPMTTDVHRIPRQRDTLTPYFVGEAAAITESTMSFEQVSLVAKKMAVLTTISSELNEDAFISIADEVSGEIAYAFAKREDECLFLGDGTSTYGGITGLANSMGSAGISQTTELTTPALTDVTSLGVFTDLMALLPQYADTRNCKWYMHKSVYHGTVEAIVREAGGNTFRDQLDGKWTPNLLGYPVVFSQVLPDINTTTDNAKIAYFGDMTLAASFGDRRSTQIQVSDQAMDVFQQDEIAVRGTERFDIVCHDCGDTNEAGPIVALTIDNDDA
jgi:HK97 family phage major capsid protein